MAALRLWATAFFLGATAWAPAEAHPHVFIDAKATFLFNDASQLNALRITWVYDTFTSLTLIALLELDSDNDGILSEADLSRVLQAQTTWPDGFEGDAYLEVDGERVPLGRPTNGAADWSDTRISVSFDLPLDVPFAVDTVAELRLYDPTYYYAYSTVDVQSAAHCPVTVRRFKPDDASANLRRQLSRLSREETPEQGGVGRLFSDVIELQCA